MTTISRCIKFRSVYCLLTTHRSSIHKWWDAGMVICLGWSADLHTAQLMPLPLTISCSSKSRLVLPFWYRLMVNCYNAQRQLQIHQWRLRSRKYCVCQCASNAELESLTEKNWPRINKLLLCVDGRVVNTVCYSRHPRVWPIDRGRCLLGRAVATV